VGTARSRSCLVAAVALLAGCFVRSRAPSAPPPDARGGHAPARFDRERACGAWRDAVGPGGRTALSHLSFPELDPEGCFVAVRYDAGRPRPDPTPDGCGYPTPGAPARLEREARRYEAIAAGASDGAMPLELRCALPDDVRRAAARVNARTLRALARRIDGSSARWPYATVSTFGFGHRMQAESALVAWRPGDACPDLGKRDMDLLANNIVRAYRAADALHAHVAPVVTLSGGAVHSPLVEAFLLDYLATCRFGVRADRVLLDPCADHTHTNFRNSGGLVIATGGRTAYVVTDDDVQSDYLQDRTFFSLFGGSVDQRALRDWGYLVGAWRQASVGMKAGFWFTPYRFWAEPEEGLGGFTCVR
jgi:hypothetical protein